jgi:molybdenum cofactor guanylyltransferase
VYDLHVKVGAECRVTAFVLAGGKSSRMGRDKAFLRWGEETLLAQALKTVSSVGEEVRIVGYASKYAAFGQIVEDVYRDRGPLGAIHAALSGTTTELNLILAVDLPFVGAKFLEYLLVRAQESGATVTVPCAGSGLQPLCGVYRREFAEIAEQSLRAGKNRIDLLFAEIATCVIEENELAQAGFSAGMFRNLNTPEEFEAAQGARSTARS